MTQLRFLLDDMPSSKTQQAVLLAFAAYLEEGGSVEVVRASQLREVRHWSDVPVESSRRLDLRLQALLPRPHQLTVFLPSHIVPGTVELASCWDATLASREFSTVADLDLFAVNNGCSEVQRFQEFVAITPDYEAVSRYAGFSSKQLPSWLISGGLVSALQVTQRPWYCAFAPRRLQWLGWVRQAVEQRLLDLSMMEEDVRTGQVRPSLLADVKAVLQGMEPPPFPDLTLDALFTPPERCLTDAQYRLLHSVALQRRTVMFARRNASRKLAKQGLLKFIWRSLRRLPRQCLRALHQIYSVTLRPIVKRLSEQFEARE